MEKCSAELKLLRNEDYFLEHEQHFKEGALVGERWRVLVVARGVITQWHTTCQGAVSDASASVTRYLTHIR